MRKSFVVLFGTLLALVLSAGTVWANTGQGSHANHWPWVGKQLRGSEEMPPVTTEMKGWLHIRYDARHDRMPFHLAVWDGKDVTMAHLHCGLAGQTGPIVVTLFGEVTGGFDINGTLVRSAIEDDNILPAGASCPTAITSVASLQTAIEKHEVYVNVHTVAHPNGEIRAQL
jgi:hypothetical protein